MDFNILVAINELQTIKESFTESLSAAAYHKKTSIAFIENPLPKHILQKDSTFQVISIGGSVFEKAIVEYINNKVELIDFQKKTLPQLKTKEIIFSFIATNFNPIFSKLALNFAYPLQPLFRHDNLDGILLKATKQHTFIGLVGEAVGHELEKYLSEKYNKKITVTVANDTVCLVLSGLAESFQNSPKYPLSSLVGGIIGTGMNFGFFLNENTVINLESGNFKNFSQTESGKYIDAQSNNTGEQLYEKEVSGAYLYQHFNYYVKKFGIQSPILTSTEQLNHLLDPGAVVSNLAKHLIERSAAFTACQIAGIYSFKNNVLNVVMEGSLFWNGFQYREGVEKYLLALGVPTEAVKFIKIEKSAVKGAACLALR